MSLENSNSCVSGLLDDYIEKIGEIKRKPSVDSSGVMNTITIMSNKRIRSMT